MSITITQTSRQYSLQSNMESAADKEERKREYNRLAQREFRRRRKEHLRNLEQAQKEQNSEQSEEIERLRYQNDELRRENEALRAQIFGPSSSSHGMLSTMAGLPLGDDGRQYSLSPSISAASMPATGSPPATISSDMMPMAALSLTSSMQAYADPCALSPQPYTMVQHSSGLRHSSVQKSSPESSGFRSSPSAMGPHFQSLNISQVEAAAQALGQGRPSGQPPNMVMVPYDHSRARAEIREIFRPFYQDPSAISNPDQHLALLRSMSENLPPSFKPSKAQLETPHYCGIDMIASPSLRDRLLTLTADVARSFVGDLGAGAEEREGVGQLIIWGDDPFNEISWELSEPILEKWDWLLGPVWKQRANFWRRQRGAPLLPEW